MTGVILENLSNKKLLIFASIALLLQITCFLIGGLLMPPPTIPQDILSTICVEEEATRQTNPNNDTWFYIWPENSTKSCHKTFNSVSEIRGKHISSNQLVFVFQMPLRRDGLNLGMSRWFQEMVSVLNLEIIYSKLVPVERDGSAKLLMDVRLAYRDVDDEPGNWHEMARSREVRSLACTRNLTSGKASYFSRVVDWTFSKNLNVSKDDENEDEDDDNELSGSYTYNCELLPLFSLGNCFHDYYLVNIRIPVDPKGIYNTKIGLLDNLWLIEIHQNGGFTQIWFLLKTLIFPVNLFALWFFHQRINELPRYANVLEGSIFILGMVMCALNVPIEWLSLWLDVPLWTLISDLRQGLYYCCLLCFWTVFVGEHAIDHSVTASSVSGGFWHGCLLPFNVYWQPLALVILGSLSLLVFDLVERGIQLLWNPFYSLSENTFMHYVCSFFMVVAAICALIYAVHLVFSTLRTLKQIMTKRRLLPSLPLHRQNYFRGVIFRFSIFLVYTLFCALLTLAFYVTSQFEEDQWKWEDDYEEEESDWKRFEYRSAFITGTYGMWNIYVFLLLCLYAPSYKGGRPGRELANELVSSHYNKRSSNNSDNNATTTFVNDDDVKMVYSTTNDTFKFFAKEALE